MSETLSLADRIVRYMVARNEAMGHVDNIAQSAITGPRGNLEMLIANLDRLLSVVIDQAYFTVERAGLAAKDINEAKAAE